MYDVEKRSAVLEDAVGFASLYTYAYDLITKWQHWGMFIIGKTNFALSRTLYKSKYHRHLFRRGSDTCAHPRV